MNLRVYVALKTLPYCQIHAQGYNGVNLKLELSKPQVNFILMHYSILLRTEGIYGRPLVIVIVDVL